MKRQRLVGLFLLLLLTAAHQASAQGRLDRGLFGSGGSDEAQQLLTATGSLSGGWDENVLADARGGRDRLRASDLNSDYRGRTAVTSAGLSYRLGTERFSFGANAATVGRYYPGIARSVLRRDHAGVSAGYKIFTTRRSRLAASAAGSYRPYSLSSLFATAIDSDSPESEAPETAGPDIDFASSLEHYVSYRGGLAYSRQLSLRSSLSGSYSYRVRESTTGASRFQSQSAGARYEYQLTRDLSLRAGYGQSRADYHGFDEPFVRHNIDAGVNYSRQLSQRLGSRRTKLSFSTGMSAAGGARARSVDGEETFNDRMRVRATGSAVLTHELGRTWNASAAYNRGVTFSQDWPEPLWSDSVSAGLGGLLSRRLQFNAGARASKGRRLGFQESVGGGFNSYHASASLGFALTRNVNSGITYSYYYHRFNQPLRLAPGYVSGIDRNSVRAYVNVWAPLFQRVRRR